MLFSVAFAAVLSLPLSSNWSVPQEARMLRLKRGSLISQIWQESERLDIDSGYTNETLGQHTVVYFPFGNGNELLFGTWSSEARRQRFTYWRRQGTNLSRVCQLEASDNGGIFSKWIRNGGAGLPTNAPSELRTFMKELKPCVEFSYNPGAGELGYGVLLSDGKEVDGVEARLAESGGKLAGDWCDANGGPPMLKHELAFLISRRSSQKLQR